MSASVGLAAVEAWDLPGLQGAVGSLSGLPARLDSWRVRLDALGGRLRTTQLWSGPAADAAATALVELSEVSRQVQLALADSSDSLRVVVTGVGTAQDEASAARSWAAAGPVTLSDAGLVAPIAVTAMAADQLAVVAEREHAAARAEGHAQDALATADAVLVAARLAGDPLAGVGVPDGGVVGDFGVVAAAAEASLVPPTVPAVDPTSAAQWWAGLTPAVRQAVIVADPTGVGSLDGLPAAARDQANRLLLDDALAHPEREGYAVARETDRQLAVVEGTAQLLLFVPGEDLVALSVGDLDTAGAVGVLVPGMNTSPGDDLAGATGDAQAVRSRAEAASPGLVVAALVWMGYQTPSWGSFYSGLNARSSGPELDRTLDGLAAARTSGALAGGPPLPRTTVLAHSYGTLVAGEAARADGELAADALVLLGSPGTGSHDAVGLEAQEVYGAWSPFDPISTSDFYGGSPYDAGFGDTDLPTTPVQLHTEYYSPWFPTLDAVAEVVAGTFEGD